MAIARTILGLVLSKLGKDYSIPKGYRPIALLNTMGKAMEFILAKRMAYLAETYQLLPATRMGDRRLRSYEHGPPGTDLPDMELGQDSHDATL